MKALLNTLYITSPDRYLKLDGENIVICENQDVIARFPLHNFESIVTFGYTGASPALMGACAKRGISLCFMSMNGSYLASVTGEMKGNVHLRREQYRIADQPERSETIVRNMLIGKMYNCKWVLARVLRDHPYRTDEEKIRRGIQAMEEALNALTSEKAGMDTMRGIEGNAARRYFHAADEMILNNKDNFYLKNRNRRPPMDRVNAMLSFLYSLLANDCASALSAAGLDPYVGFMHADRPGRVSLALDLMEEMRPILVDRLVFSMINRREVEEDDFILKENKSVLFTDAGKKKILTKWQDRKKEILTHPFLKEKVEWGLIPHIQALLLARHIRGDLDEYPVFFWK